VRRRNQSRGTSESPAPAINEIVVSKPTGCTSPLLLKVCAAGRPVVAGRPMRLTAPLDVTRIDGDGREITVVSVTMHDVVIARDTAPPRVASAATEGFRLRYRRMTYAGLPRSSPDVSQVVRDVWLPARPHWMPRWPREI
jgi:type VI protein secretion system component Hcp